mmetsp:Transcript_1895/g.4249  ORF Transcript_1895/g.4249 Transcript_1895/m.4249 type:complete len:108 (+) Transcript_1895:411-734(+)
MSRCKEEPGRSWLSMTTEADCTIGWVGSLAVMASNTLPMTQPSGPCRLVMSLRTVLEPNEESDIAVLSTLVAESDGVLLIFRNRSSCMPFRLEYNDERPLLRQAGLQ